ncbi:MAG: glycosyltransferase [Thermoanaerobaculales bacterium]|nr:glycosyltransferase [Thermoanaerobaculales bacterium]
MVDISVIVPTLERASHLERCLISLCRQRGVSDGYEIIVSADGSGTETAEVVAQLSRDAPVSLHLVTHRGADFCPAACRNRGVLQSSGRYLVFCDGDCVVPPDHLAVHQRRRRQGVALVGDPTYLDRATTESLTVVGLEQQLGSLKTPFLPVIRARFHQMVRHPTLPKLSSGFFSLWRRDFELINGFDQRFVGWGCEDDDLRLRLRRAGVRIESIQPHTRSFHLWHPPHASRTEHWRDGPNVPYLQRDLRLTRCVEGLTERTAADLRMASIGGCDRPEVARRRLGSLDFGTSSQAEIEVLFAPGSGAFSKRADCRVVVVLEGGAAPRIPNVQLVFSDASEPDRRRRFPLGDLERLPHIVIQADSQVSTN